MSQVVSRMKNQRGFLQDSGQQKVSDARFFFLTISYCNRCLVIYHEYHDTFGKKTKKLKNIFFCNEIEIKGALGSITISLRQISRVKHNLIHS